MNLRDDPTDPNTWLGRAQSSLILAEQGQSIVGVSLEDRCFHAQQAGEKAFKVVCVKYNSAFPKTHSLVRLIDILEENGVSIPKNIKAADILSLYAVETRYPGVSEKVTKTEYKTALKLASQVVSWAKGEITK
jgi:HEPN domain-containing protein